MTVPWYREHDFPIVLANMPVTVQQRRLALIVIALLLLIALIAAPFATVQLPQVGAFVPVLQTLMCMADVVTAVLLFAQYSVQRQLAILVLACGYISSGLFAFLQTLSFPGAYTPGVLIGDGLNSPAWFFVLWHTTFPLGVLVYALWKDADSTTLFKRRSNATIIGSAVVCVLLIDAGLAWLAAKGTAYLPTMYAGDLLHQTSFASRINIFLWLCGLTALVVLFVQRRTILDLWLIVTLIAWMPNFLVAMFITAARFSVAWYLARGYALVASFMLLSILLTETTLLYSRLATAILLQRRERMGRLMSLETAVGAIAHELRQPLAAIGFESDAAGMFLENTPPKLEGVRECLSAIGNATERADKAIASIRALFKGMQPRRASVEINEVVQQVLTLASHDLQVNHVSVTAEYRGGLPAIQADAIQIQQVLLNLIKNAIDAMTATPSSSRALRVATSHGSDSDILLLVEDTGPGLTADPDRIFEPFVTTKASGMGLGLAISRTIIEDHGGALRVARTSPHGTAFELTLPLNGAQAPKD